MIEADDFDAMDALIEKAKTKSKIIPEVTIVEFGTYEVTRSSGGFYTIQIGENDFGEIWIACYCRAGLEGKACYHARAAFPIHKMLHFASNKPKENDPAKTPYIKDNKQNLTKIGSIRV